MKFLKWTLGFSTRASNLPCWGDTGRLPIAVTFIKQAFNYIKRLESLKHSHRETVAENALIEQEHLSLHWFKRLRELQEQLGMNRSLDAAKALSNIKNKFKRLWTSAMPLNSKLHSYNIVKLEITFEPYLTINEYERRRALAQLRSSNHRLNCETGRYDLNKSPKYNSKLELDNKLWRKCCKICCGPQAETLSHLPFFGPIIEDEQNFLATCPLYQNQGCKSGFFIGGGGIIGKILPKFAISRVWGMIFPLKSKRKLSNFQFHVPQKC